LARPVKKPSEQWKQEIMDAAQNLFLANGYDETSVSDIMVAANGAKGTFYLFFETKDQLLRALVDKWADVYKKAVIDVLDDKSTPFAMKFMAIITVITQMSGKTFGMEAFFKPSNEIIIHQLTKKMTETITPFLAETLKSGTDEGLFQINNPLFYANFIIHGALGALNYGKNNVSQNIQDNLIYLPQIIADILKTEVSRIYSAGTGG
jgi:AcrR family transcriptional regulator